MGWVGDMMARALAPFETPTISEELEWPTSTSPARTAFITREPERNSFSSTARPCLEKNPSSFAT